MEPPDGRESNAGKWAEPSLRLRESQMGEVDQLQFATGGDVAQLRIEENGNFLLAAVRKRVLFRIAGLQESGVAPKLVSAVGHEFKRRLPGFGQLIRVVSVFRMESHTCIRQVQPAKYHRLKKLQVRLRGDAPVQRTGMRTTQTAAGGPITFARGARPSNAF